jgi:hypothetical protein
MSCWDWRGSLDRVTGVVSLDITRGHEAEAGYLQITGITDHAARSSKASRVGGCC